MPIVSKRNRLARISLLYVVDKLGGFRERGRTRPYRMDCSAECAKRQVPTPSTGRAFQSPQSHIANRSAEIGNRAEMPVKSLFDRSARTRSGLFSENCSDWLFRRGSRRSAPFDRSGTFERRLQRFAKFCIRCFRNAVPSDNNDIDATAHQRDERCDSFAQAPFDAVSAHAVSLFLADGNADTRLPRPTVRNNDDHKPMGSGFADTIGVAEFFFLFECIFAFHRITRPEKVCAKPSELVRLKKRAASRCLPQAPVSIFCTQKTNAVMRSAFCGPLRVCASKRCDRLRSSCAYESHAPCCAAVFSADRYVPSLTPHF